MFWKNLSQVINKNALGQSDGKIFKFQYHKSYLRYKFPFFMQFDHVIFFGFSQARPNCSKKKISNTDFEKRFIPSIWFFGFK